jgi:hypothetical protein
MRDAKDVCCLVGGANLLITKAGMAELADAADSESYLIASVAL